MLPVGCIRVVSPDKGNVVTIPMLCVMWYLGKKSNIMTHSWSSTLSLPDETHSPGDDVLRINNSVTEH